MAESSAAGGPPSRLRRALRTLGRIIRVGALALALLLAFVAGVSVIATAHVKVRRPDPPPIVNDVTQLNPIPVRKIATPTTTEEVAELVKSHEGPISVGGGRYSMGGQTATRGALQLDMRQMNRILALDTTSRIITVQAGARWRQIQQVIDSFNLSIKI